MTSPKLPPAHDLVRFLRPQRAEIEDAIRHHLLNRPALLWTYERWSALYGPAFDDSVPLSALLHGVGRKAPEQERRAIGEVVQLLRDYGKGRAVECHDAPKPDPFSIRSDLAIPGRFHFTYNEGRVPRIVFVQPRRKFSPTDRQLAVLAALQRQAVPYDYREAGALVDIIDLSMREGVREYRLLTPDMLPTISEAELREALSEVVAAFDAVVATLDWASITRTQAEKAAERRRRAAERDGGATLF